MRRIVGLVGSFQQLGWMLEPLPLVIGYTHALLGGCHGLGLHGFVSTLWLFLLICCPP